MSLTLLEFTVLSTKITSLILQASAVLSSVPTFPAFSNLSKISTKSDKLFKFTFDFSTNAINPILLSFDSILWNVFLDIE